MQEKIKRAMPLVISGLMIVLIFLIEFVTIKGNDNIDIGNFILNLAVNSAIIISVATAWMTSGTDRAKRNDKLAYNLNLTKYSQGITTINEQGHLGKLKEFCERKNKEMKERKINSLLNSVCIDRKEYDEKYRMMPQEQLKKIKLSRIQIAAVCKIQKDKVRIRENNVQELMTNSKTNEDYGTHYNEKADKSIRLSIRVLKSVITATVLLFLVMELSTNIKNITAWVMFVMKLITVVYTAWSAEREGYEQIADTKNKVILRRIMFLNLFAEEEKIQLFSNSKNIMNEKGDCE